MWQELRTNFDSISTALNKISNDLATTLLGYAVLLASVGALSVALLEVWKNLRGTRKRFNRERFDQWLSQGEEAALVRAQLVALATGGYELEDALFDQPIEKMMGQIQAAANMALDYPIEYRSLFDFLAREPHVLQHDDHPRDREYWRDFAKNIRGKSDGHAPGQDKDVAAAAQARARLSNLVARKMDAFQNDTQYAWDRWNQRRAVSMGTIILELIFVIQAGVAADANNWLKVIVLTPVAVLGGCVAPFAKDLVSKLGEVGKRG